MKKNPITSAVAAGCCFLLLSLWNYLSGRFGFHYDLVFLPGGLLLLLGAVILALRTLFAIVVSLTERQFLAALLAVLLLGVSGWFPFTIRSNLYLIGVRQRISSQVTHDQLRQMAARATLLLGSERGISSPSNPSWDKMLEVPGFSNLVEKRVLFTGPYGVMVGLGGCSVCGHTGLQVQEPTITSRYSKGGHLSIAPDIEVFYDPK